MERYAHLAADWVKESADRTSESIAADILTGYPAFRCGASPSARSTVKKDDRETPTPGLRTIRYAGKKSPTGTWSAGRW